MFVTDPSYSVSWSLYRWTDEIIFIIDNDIGGCSVTNAAERVVRQVVARYGDRRIVYRDTMSCWAEMKHVNGSFTGFKPYGGAV